MKALGQKMHSRFTGLRGDLDAYSIYSKGEVKHEIRLDRQAAAGLHRALQAMARSFVFILSLKYFK